MRSEEKVSFKVANKHIRGLYAMFNLTGHGELLWESLTDGEREMFCKKAGFLASVSCIPLSRMRPDTRRKILDTIQEINRVSSIFNNISFCDFG